MKKSTIFAVSLTAVVCAGMTLTLAAKDELPQVTEDGLHLVPDSKLAVVYAEPEADLSIYNRIKLLDAYVAFKKNWERDMRSRSADPLAARSVNTEKIKDQLAAEFQSVFTQVLEEGGYEIVDEAADDVLLIRPAIINLDIKNPDSPSSMGRTRDLTASAGEMTLYLELYDSVTGDLIVKALDRKADKDISQGFYTWSNSVTNKQASERILRGWAGILLDALNEAKS